MNIDILYIILAILSFLVLFFSYFCFKFALIILKMQNIIENSLDEIDECYSVISQVLETPVFYNSPEIKRVLDEVRIVKDIILNISANFSNIKEDSNKGQDFE